MNANWAHNLITAARKRAAVINRPVSIAVVDGAGHLVGFERMDGAPLISIRLAEDKAYTAALLRMSTLQLGQMASPGGPLFGIHTTHGGRIVIFGGGEPVGQGAIGISGGTVAEDVAIARWAIEALTTTRENDASP